MIKINKIEKEPIIIYYKDEKIGECETLLTFQNIRLQIAQEYLSESNKGHTEDSDYSFEIKGHKIKFKKDASYDWSDSKINWEDMSLNFVSGILKLKFGMK